MVEQLRDGEARTELRQRQLAPRKRDRVPDQGDPRGLGPWSSNGDWASQHDTERAANHANFRPQQGSAIKQPIRQIEEQSRNGDLPGPIAPAQPESGAGVCRSTGLVSDRPQFRGKHDSGYHAVGDVKQEQSPPTAGLRKTPRKEGASEGNGSSRPRPD